MGFSFFLKSYSDRLKQIELKKKNPLRVSLHNYGVKRQKKKKRKRKIRKKKRWVGLIIFVLLFVSLNAYACVITQALPVKTSEP